MEATVIYDKVRDHYGSIAKSTGNDQASKIAQAFGYTVDDLASIPKDANLGLSCGNPLILAKLQEVGGAAQLFIRTQLLTSGSRERPSSTWEAGQALTYFWPPKRWALPARLLALI